MMKRLMPALLAWSIFPAIPLHAQPAPLQVEALLSPAYATCIRWSGGVMVVMRDCAALEYARLDNALNQTWRSAVNKLSDNTARARLRQLQREWIRTRWAACDEKVAQSGMVGGQSGLLIHDHCQLGVVAQRISWLETYQP